VARVHHACLLSTSDEQRAEVAVRFTRTHENAVFLGLDPTSFLRRLREDGYVPVAARPGPTSCDALATIQAGFTRLCLYDNARLTGAKRAEIIAAHHVVVVAPAVFDDGVLRITRIADGLRLAGEVDVSNRGGLVAAMTADVQVIDMRSLRFVDAGGVAAMYSAVRSRVRLRYPQPVPRQVIELFDPKATRLVCEGAGSG
jgi:hypothetical protein